MVLRVRGNRKDLKRPLAYFLSLLEISGLIVVETQLLKQFNKLRIELRAVLFQNLYNFGLILQALVNVTLLERNNSKFSQNIDKFFCQLLAIAHLHYQSQSFLEDFWLLFSCFFGFLQKEIHFWKVIFHLFQLRRHEDFYVFRLERQPFLTWFLKRHVASI